MSDTQRVLRGRSDEELLAKIKGLNARRQRLRDRARASVSEEVKQLLKELHERLESVRAAYLTVDTRAFPNVVVADLSELQGQEREIRTQLSIWENSKEAIKDLDDEIKICEDILVERQSGNL
jgi:hypothetical protein